MIEKVSERVFIWATEKREEFPFVNDHVFFQEEEIRFEELMASIIRKYVFIFESFMLKFFHRWENLSLQEWHRLLDDIIKDPLKPAWALDAFLIFFYQYLEIDFISRLASSSIQVNPDFQKRRLKDYLERPGRFYIDKDYMRERINEFNFKETSLKRVHDNLVIQGALEAEPIIITSHKEKRHGIDLFHVQGPVPKSWTWKHKI
jgi:hypothetical protein